MLKSKKMVELLSPAGDINSMYAAFAAGADAVYAGADEFSARAYAANFDVENLIKAVDYVHLIGKKLYLTLNILMKEDELKRLHGFLAPLYRAGLDGCIVQDPGVVRLIREEFKGLEIHGSTQMSVSDPWGAELCRKRGLCRIVTARELSLEEIRNIHEKVDIEIETFIHGAMCYSYSGYCLFSSFLGGRSGNRGRCAGPCRQPYMLGGENGYFLSMKDMCALEILPKIIEAGVKSLKIEGRMKAPEYVYGVTKIYRKYLDRYYVNPQDFRVDPEELEELVRLYSRNGLNRGYYERRNSPDMITVKKGAYSTDFAGVKIEKPPAAKITGICTAGKGKPVVLKVKYKDIEAEAAGALVQAADRQPVSPASIEERLKKTGDTPFEFSELKIRAEDNIFIPVGVMNALRREALQKLKEEVLHEYRRSL